MDIDEETSTPGVLDPSTPGVLTPSTPGVLTPSTPGVLNPSTPGVLRPGYPRARAWDSVIVGRVWPSAEATAAVALVDETRRNRLGVGIGGCVNVYRMRYCVYVCIRIHMICM